MDGSPTRLSQPTRQGPRISTDDDDDDDDRDDGRVITWKDYSVFDLEQ